MAITRKISSGPLACVSAGIFQRALVDESGMMLNRSEIVAMLGTP
jgi:hypothetical protein